MAIESGTSSAHGRLEKKLLEASATGEPAACDILLVGPEALALRGMLQKLISAPSDKGAAPVIDGAESILEAVLMSGGGGRSSDVPLILAGIAQELDQIEPAVRSMRKVYPGSRIVLLCEPGDEVVCRRAKSWGATDYIILPAEPGVLRKFLAVETAATGAAPALKTPLAAKTNGHAADKVIPPGGTTPASAPAAPAPAAMLKTVVEVSATPIKRVGEAAILPGDAGAMSSGEQLRQRLAAMQDLSLPSLPLMVQAVLFNDLLLGRTDFVERVIATLQAYVKWGGTLKFIAAEEPGDGAAGAGTVPESSPQLRAAVGLPQQPPFGTLFVEPVPGAAASAAAAAALSQAAHWLASLLAISRRYEQLRSLAITDELSGAYNRRYFTKFMSGLLERARTNRFRVTLLLFDIDDFKKYNDTFGHASGDAIIRELIKLLRSCTRPHDLVARLGGDEFAAVYWDNEAPRHPNSEHPRDARTATERFRKAVQKHQWAQACNIQGEVSISGGLATFPWDADSLESLMIRADEALLRAKAGGKNVFLLHGEHCAGGKISIAPPPGSSTGPNIVSPG